jgi:hypothetical protein
MDFIFGYGSLINTRSRKKTWAAASTCTTVFNSSPDSVENSEVEGIPARIRGFERHWSVRSFGRKYTALGCSKQKRVNAESNITDVTYVNGVIFQCDDKEGLKAFDTREYGYTRVQVEPEAIEFLYSSSGSDSPKLLIRSGKAKVWVYLNDAHDYPNAEFPLAQTYIDIVLTGCLDIHRDFAIEFIKCTWKSASEIVKYEIFHWVNDREPALLRRYMRAEKALDLPVDEIDSLLHLYIPEALKQRLNSDTKE